jgi:hypothetical protein
MSLVLKTPVQAPYRTTAVPPHRRRVMMKRMFVVLMSVMFVFAVATAFAARGTGVTFKAKTGDTIYVCGCGEGCDCGTLSKSAGTCGCGKALVETKVTKVEKGMVYYKLDDKELSAPAKGLYVCPCGKKCKCLTVSQKPGKCGCGQDLVKTKK